MPAQTPAAPAVSSSQTTAAVQLVAKTYAPNSMAKVAGSKVGLPRNGSWGARVATAAELTGACDETGAVCVAVLYHAGTPEITCRWTVVFAPGDGIGRVVSQSDTAAMYMLRAFPVGAPDMPLLESGLAPNNPPIAEVARITGRVHLIVDVDPNGVVQGAVVLDSSNAVFNQSVLVAGKDWRFEPTVLDGQRVWAQCTVEVVFAGGPGMLSLRRAK